MITLGVLYLSAKYDIETNGALIVVLLIADCTISYFWAGAFSK